MYRRLGLLTRLAWSLPFLVVHSLLAFSYYAYIVRLIGGVVDSVYLRVVYGSIYHLLLVMALWAYYKAVFTKPTAVSSKWHITQEEWDALANHEPSATLHRRRLPVVTHNGFQTPRWCPVCRIIKPDRCRHCSACGVCIKRYDHHCPWVANCVGLHNYKFFCLFLFYMLAFLLFVGATSLRYAILYLGGHGANLFAAVVCFLALMFSLSVGALAGLHISLLLNNGTTVEMGRQPTFVRETRSGFKLDSKRANFAAIFGPDPLLWPLPIATTQGDGETYPVEFDSSGSEAGAIELFPAPAPAPSAPDASKGAPDAPGAPAATSEEAPTESLLEPTLDDDSADEDALLMKQ